MPLRKWRFCFLVERQNLERTGVVVAIGSKRALRLTSKFINNRSEFEVDT
jgi:hypothetical protein